MGFIHTYENVNKNTTMYIVCYRYIFYTPVCVPENKQNSSIGEAEL